MALFTFNRVTVFFLFWVAMNRLLFSRKLLILQCAICFITLDVRRVLKVSYHRIELFWKLAMINKNKYFFSIWSFLVKYFGMIVFRLFCCDKKKMNEWSKRFFSLHYNDCFSWLVHCLINKYILQEFSKNAHYFSNLQFYLRQVVFVSTFINW
jgi:hypothetical protein